MNKKNITTTLLLLITIISYSQESRFSYGIALDVGISSRATTTDLALKDYFPAYDRIVIDYELGAIIEYKLTDKFRLQSGIKYVKYASDSGKESVAFDEWLHPGVDAIRLETDALSVTLPLKIVYYKNVTNSKFFLTAAYSPSINMNNKVTFTDYYPNEKTEVSIFEFSETPKRVNFVGELGIGWEESLSKKLSLFFYPNLKFQTLKKSQHIRIDRRFIFCGISIGLKIK